MKKLKMLLVLSVLANTISAQSISQIAAYDNNSSTTSGIFAVGDTALYRYSWYFQAWFPLSNNGLVKINDTTRINSLAVYNNESSNSSGIFVFSDTAVFNYNWITATWYALSNNGLPYINQKPNIKQLAVYGPSGSSSNSTLFALCDTAIFRYSWYFQHWTALPNTGLITSNKIAYDTSKNDDIVLYPNPFTSDINIEINLPNTSKRTIQIAVYNKAGQVVYENIFNTEGSKHINIQPEIRHLPSGLYIYEIYDGTDLKILKGIKL